MLESEDFKRIKLINELKKGEQSGYIEDFDRDAFLKKIHEKVERLEKNDNNEENSEKAKSTF